MKQTKIFIAIGTFALTVAGFLVTKGNKKFTGVTAGKFRGISAVNGGTFSGFQANNFTTAASGFKTVYLKTVGNTKLATLVTSTGGSLAKTVYYMH